MTYFEKDWIKETGLKALWAEPELLVSTDDALAIAKNYIQKENNTRLLSMTRSELSRNLYSLWDIEISSVSNPEPVSTSFAADIFFAERYTKNKAWCEEEHSFVALHHAILDNELLSIDSKIKKSAFSTNYLLFLGGQGAFGADFDLNKTQSIIYSGHARYAKTLDLKQEELYSLGFTFEVQTQRDNLRLIISLAKPDTKLWKYFLCWWMDQVVILGKPVDYYNCTFYLPLDVLLEKDIEKSAMDKKSQGDYISKLLVGSSDSYKYKTGDVPVKPNNDNEKALEKAINSEHEAWIYFLPHQRRYLFDEKKSKDIYGDERIQPIREFRLFDYKKDNQSEYIWELQIPESETQTKPESVTFQVPIKQVILYTYFNGMMYLAIQTEKSVNIEEQWMLSILMGSDQDRENIKRNQYNSYLKFTKNARVLYPSFVDAKDEGKHYVKALYKDNKLVAQDDQNKLTTLVGEDSRFKASELLSKPIVFLLSEFFKGEKIKQTIDQVLDNRLCNLPDDRMFVSVSYCTRGKYPEEDIAQKRLFSYALNVDDDSMIFSEFDDFCYEKDFVLNQLESDVYKRWISLGTWSGATDFSNVYMGNDWFFKEQVASKHVVYLYNRMLLSALFYKLSFEHYNRRITKETNRLLHRPWLKRFFSFLKPPFNRLRKGFILFVNQYWFTELTYQVQGKELFQMILKHLRIEEQFEGIKSELHNADEYVNNTNAKAWGIIALIISVCALLEFSPQIFQFFSCLVHGEVMTYIDNTYFGYEALLTPDQIKGE